MKFTKYILALYCLFIATLLFCGCSQREEMQTLVLIDSNDPHSVMAKEYLIPYLDHFGILYEVSEIHTQNHSKPASAYALVIIGHPMTYSAHSVEMVQKIMGKGAGLVSFDPSWGQHNATTSLTDTASLITFNSNHYITQLHEKTDTIRAFKKFPLYRLEGKGLTPLVFADSKPLLLISESHKNRMVYFTSMDWMKTHHLGPLMGLDDCLWRSFVWAARKPFVLRGLPPLVTMRVDDVAGRGGLWDESPLYWVEASAQYGFKPWLGLFIYNLDPETINELRGYIDKGQATASPHALGRPNRSDVTDLDIKSYVNSRPSDPYAGLYYNPEALPLRVNTYDEFIFFDHHSKIPWSDEEAIRGLEAIDRWYAKNQYLPISKYLVPHWYEIGNNVIPHIYEKWGIEFIALNSEVNMPYADSVPWITGGPFRLFEEPGTSTANPALRGGNPVYYADFVEIDGYRFFNCLTEIRDDAGYEWAPDNNTESSAQRGIRQLRRALSSMALAVLFTHETDFIYRIHPESWKEQIKLIHEGIQDFEPMLLTTDDAMMIVRAHKTSQITNCIYNNRNKQMKVTFEGETDTESYFYLFTTKNGIIDQQLIEVPQFSGLMDVDHRISQ